VKMVINIIILFSLLLRSAAAQSPYCSITPSHSLCGSSGASNACGSVYYRGLTQAEKREALEQHNRLRSRVAVGSTNQPSAADMMELRWDDELAAVAQGHADNCLFVHDCTDCRKIPRFRVGQNIYRAKDYRFEAPEWRRVIDSWFSEIDLFPGLGSIASYRYTPGTGHYTQMTWASITSVGCGLITHKNSDTNPFIARFYVCNYGPGGNFVGRKMYQPGRACSSCPRSSTCSSSYPGLCSTNSFTTSSVPRSISSRVINQPTRVINQQSSRFISSNNATSNAVRNNIQSNIINTRPASSVSTRREPRIADNRFSPRQGVITQGQVARPRPVRPSRNIRNRRQRRPACKNILCTLARLFE